MTDFQNSFLNIICTSVKGDIREMSKKFDFDSAFDFCKEQNIVPIIYYGTIRCISVAGYNCCEDYYNHTCDLLTLESKQTTAAKKLKKAFSGNGIDHILCGKAVFKKLYKYPEMSASSRVVFGVRKEQYDMAVKVAEDCGFVKGTHNAQNSLFETKDGVRVVITNYPNELKRLSDIKENDIWENAAKISEHEYEMLPEFALYCSFLKFADRYIDGKAKISHIIDMYLLKNACTKRGIDSVADRVEGVGLRKFYMNILNLLESWFDNLYPDSITNLMTNRIFNSENMFDKSTEKLSLGYKIKKALFLNRRLNSSTRLMSGDAHEELEAVGLKEYSMNKN